MILPFSISDWPPEWREAFEERAAIMEFMAHMKQADAEKLAEAVIRRQANEEERWEPLT